MKIKQLFHFVLACGLMLSTASCTDEVVTNNGDGTDSAEVPEGMQALTLKVGGISGGNVTKAGGIAKPEEIEVNDMTIYIFKYDPAKGADDTDDANYTLYDYWTYMKTPVTDYTANSRNLHTFTLGGSGQFRTATIYLPKEAGKVKCLVTTGTGLICDPDGKDFSSWLIDHSYLLSGLGISNPYDADLRITSYKYKPYPSNILALTLTDLKQATWRGLSAIQMPKATDDGSASTIPTDYQKTPLSMMGESGILDIGAQSGNSSQIEATLKRHVSRLDIINANSLDIRKIELINLPFSTNFVPPVDCIEATTQITLGTVKTAKTGDDPVDSYTVQAIYDKTEAMANAMTAYVYPNLPYNTTETAKNTPFIRVSLGDTPDVYILPLRTKNEDGSFTPVNLKSNHRYTLQLNRLGDNFLDYNIVIEDWQAGADFNVNLGQEVTAEQFNYQPVFLSYTEDPTWNQTIMEGEKAYCYLTSGSSATGTWIFRTAPTLAPNGSDDINFSDIKFNILKSTSQSGIGTPVTPTDYTASEIGLGSAPSYYLHKVSITFNNNKPLYTTTWYTVRNPYNPGKSTRVKLEGVIHPDSDPQYAFQEALYAMAETNALTEGVSQYTVADFQADSYYTQWPDKGAAMTTGNVYDNIPDITPLLPPFDVTGTALDNSTGIDLAAGGFKKFTDNRDNYTIASNGDAEMPCLILQAPLSTRMWERKKGDDGTYYIRIVCVDFTYTTIFNSFEAMRSAIRNVENGYDTTWPTYLERHFPEGNYWKYNAGGNKRLSFEPSTFGKEITEGTTGYIRPAHAVPTP